MGEQQHTPGPWTIETPMGEETPWIVEAGKQSYEWHCIAIVPIEPEDEDDLPIPQARANARLIAAAPELLGALTDLLASWSTESGWMNNDLVADRARAAIAKATGASNA
jgi:hypothetical protein